MSFWDWCYLQKLLELLVRWFFEVLQRPGVVYGFFFLVWAHLYSSVWCCENLAVARSETVFSNSFGEHRASTLSFIVGSVGTITSKARVHDAYDRTGVYTTWKTCFHPSPRALERETSRLTCWRSWKPSTSTWANSFDFLLFSPELWVSMRVTLTSMAKRSSSLGEKKNSYILPTSNGSHNLSGVSTYDFPLKEICMTALNPL